MGSLDVVGIGNAIVDAVAEADDALLADEGLPKGSMTLIDAARARALRIRAWARRSRSAAAPPPTPWWA